MPNPIDPFKKKQPIAKPVDQAKHQELLARSTGTAPRPQLPTPPPAKPLPPGISGTPPLPVGRPVVQTAPSSLTEVERQTLQAAGWTDTDGLPTTHEGMKELREAVAKMQAVEVPFPQPQTPFVEPTAIPFDTLPKEKQADIMQAATSATNVFQQIANKDAQRTAEQKQQQSSVAGMNVASGVVNKAMSDFQAKLNQEQTHQVTVPTPTAPVPVVAQPAAPAPTPTPTPAPAPTSETGANAMLTHCPHCRWDLALPDVPEPDYSDKIAFVHTMLGQKDFSKVYTLFNGTVSVKFRTLTTREIDTIHAQTYQDRISGRISEEQLDFYERLNRYRMCLQLIDFSSTAANIAQPLPDGYSLETNPLSENQWLTPTQQAELSIQSPNETGLPNIETWLIENILRSERLYRVVVNTCHQFNRLVSKMEAMADNSDFWRPTEGQS